MLCWKVPGAVVANRLNNGVLVLFNSIKVSEVVRRNIFSNKKMSGNESIVNKVFKPNIPTTDQSIVVEDRSVKAT